MVVVISGHGTIETAVKATKLGAFDFLEKPLSIGKVSVVVKNALAHRTLAIENSRLKADTGARYRIIGESVPMKALRQHDANLVLGELVTNALRHGLGEVVVRVRGGGGGGGGGGRNDTTPANRRARAAHRR